MSILSDFDVDKVCRVCLTRSENMKSLFAVSSSAVVLSFAELLSKFTPIQCATNDGLPNQLCNNCTNQLTQFNTFHAKCVETNQALQAYVEKRRKTDVNVFAAVDIKTEFDPVEAIYIEETDHQNDVYTNFNSLKNPLDISDLQVDLEQDLDVIKHEIDENTTAKINLTSKNTPQTTITTINTGLDTLELIAKPYACETRIANPGFEEVLIKTDAEESIFMGNQGHLDISVLKIGPKRNTSLMIHEIGEIQAKLPENATDNASNVEEALEKPYACTLCTSAFKAMKNLNVHMKKHRGGKPYSCPTCSRTFNRKSYFAVHLRTHTGERPYACAMCESSFNEKSALTVHTRMHTNERPFPCTVCDSSFKQKATLTAHMRKHNGEKPYACYICKLAFRQDAHLKTHMRTHTGERPYWCPVCKRAFKQKISLTRHVRVHTGEKPYACTYCKSVFNQRRKLAKHLRTHADTPLG